MIKKYDAQIVHTGSADCSINFPNESFVWRDLKEGFKDGEKVTVTINTRRKPRTLKQNSVLYWYLTEISDETGMSVDEVKEAMRYKFLGVDVIDKNGEIMAEKDPGEVLRTYRSTTALTTIEFNEFTENIRLWAISFLNLNLPLPNEETELKFK